MVVTQSEAVAHTLREIKDDLEGDVVTERVERALPDITTEITDLLVETHTLVGKGANFTTLRRIGEEWEQISRVFPAWSRELTTRASQLDSELARLDELSTTWKNTQHEAQATEIPPEVLDRIQTLQQQIDGMRKQVEDRRAQVLALQSRVSAQGGRGAEAQVLLSKARADSASLLLVQDSAHLWSANAYRAENVAREVSDDWASIVHALVGYAQRNWQKFLLHAILVALLGLMIIEARKHLREQVMDEPQCEGILAVFSVPFATAYLLTVLAFDLLYARPPRLLDFALSILIVIATTRVLLQVLDRRVLPLVKPLFAFYLLDLARHNVITVPVANRFVFLAETVAATAYALVVMRAARMRLRSGRAEGMEWTVILWIARVGGCIFSFAAGADVLGYMALSRLVGDVSLNSLYLGLVLFGLERVFEGVLIFLTRIRPLAGLALVANHRPQLRASLRKGLTALGVLLWGYVVLDQITLARTVSDYVTRLLTADVSVGGADISLGGILLFGLAVWGSFTLSRFISFVLDEDVYPRVKLARGLPYAISTMVHYVVLVCGFFLGLAALGIDMTKFTIVVGAFSVGLGFGLQNVVSNFVSGLILLFERPANVGDILEVSGHMGELRHIGLRASVLRSTDGSETIVPNGLLTSQQVVNWTLSDQRRRLDIDVPVVYDCIPERALEIMLGVAVEHPEVLKHPAPQVLLKSLGPKDMTFELRVWTAQFNGGTAVRSALNLSLVTALRAAGIRISSEMRLDLLPPAEETPSS